MLRTFAENSTNTMRYLPLLFLLIACTNTGQIYDSFGGEITQESAIGVTDFLAQVSEEESTYKVKGTIEEVCQMKGCWMTLKNEEGVNIRVTFKDYGFFVPKDISGREVIIEGTALKEVLEEDLAKHYAEDGGKEYDESMRNAISFEAVGVLVAQAEEEVQS